jgi:hypothetical protein
LSSESQNSIVDCLQEAQISLPRKSPLPLGRSVYHGVVGKRFGLVRLHAVLEPGNLR